MKTRARNDDGAVLKKKLKVKRAGEKRLRAALRKGPSRKPQRERGGGGFVALPFRTGPAANAACTLILVREFR